MQEIGSAPGLHIDAGAARPIFAPGPGSLYRVLFRFARVSDRRASRIENVVPSSCFPGAKLEPTPGSLT